MKTFSVNSISPQMGTTENLIGYFRNQFLLTIISFIVLIVILATVIIRLCCCTIEIQSDLSSFINNNEKYGMTAPTIVHVSVGTDTCNLDEFGEQCPSV